MTRGKRIAESLCFDYFRTHDVEIRVARFSIHMVQEWPKMMGEW